MDNLQIVIDTNVLFSGLYSKKARCDYLITYSKQDFTPVKIFGVALATSKEFLNLINE